MTDTTQEQMNELEKGGGGKAMYKARITWKFFFKLWHDMWRGGAIFLP